MEERVNITVRASKSLALREFLDQIVEFTGLGYKIDVDPTSSGYPRARSNGNVFSVDMVLGDSYVDERQDEEMEVIGEVVEDISPELSPHEDDSGDVEESQLTLEEKLSAIDAASKKADVLALAAKWNFEVPVKMKRPTQIQAYLRKAIKED